VGLAVLLCGCLALAGFTTFWEHDGGSDLTIADASPLPTDAPGGDAAPSGVRTAPGDAGRLPLSAQGKPARTGDATRANGTTPASRARPPHRTPPGTTKSTPAQGTTLSRATSGKKGAALWRTPGISSALRDSGASWFYNWSNQRDGVSAPGVEFVPMIWGAGSVTAGNLAAAKADGRALLGFNEPDLAEQSNLSVDQALSLWPQLQDTGLRLGSPAVAQGGADPDGWLDRFLSGAGQRGYRVDFITLHWYGSDFRPDAATDQLRSYVTAVWNRYHKPIWITEYSLMNFGGGARLPSPSVQAEFVQKSTAMLEGLPFVERYAWFAFPTSRDGSDGTGLYRNGTATVPGRAYRAAG
jgi:putative glycosyl hydrolase